MASCLWKNAVLQSSSRRSSRVVIQVMMAHHHHRRYRPHCVGGGGSVDIPIATSSAIISQRTFTTTVSTNNLLINDTDTSGLLVTRDDKKSNSNKTINYRSNIPSCSHNLSTTTMTTRRWKHGARMGQHLARLDEMAHEKQHEEAVERRKKKKNKTMARKGKKGASHHHDEDVAAATDEAEGFDEYHEDEYHEEDHHEEDETVLPDPVQVKQRMKSIVDRFRESLKAIRGAEPTVELFDDVQVNAYGSKTTLQSVAQVVISSPTLAMATCFDPAVAKDVSNAIRDHLELNPSVEEGGGVVKIPLPRVSMESRQHTAAALGKRAESYRQRIRKVRNNVLNVVKKGVNGKLEGISKDDSFRVLKEIEVATDEAIQSLNEVAEKKRDSIMAM